MYTATPSLCTRSQSCFATAVALPLCHCVQSHIHAVALCTRFKVTATLSPCHDLHSLSHCLAVTLSTVKVTFTLPPVTVYTLAIALSRCTQPHSHCVHDHSHVSRRKRQSLLPHWYCVQSNIHAVALCTRSKSHPRCHHVTMYTHCHTASL